MNYQLDNSVTLYAKFKNLTNTDYYSPSKIQLFTQGIQNRGFEMSVGIEFAL